MTGQKLVKEPRRHDPDNTSLFKVPKHYERNLRENLFFRQTLTTQNASRTNYAAAATQSPARTSKGQLADLTRRTGGGILKKQSVLAEEKTPRPAKSIDEVLQTGNEGNKLGASVKNKLLKELKQKVAEKIKQANTIEDHVFDS